MKGKLAIHGGKPTVPEGLKKRWPHITQEDKDAVLGVLERNVFTGEEHGPEAAALEREWAEFTRSKHAMAFNTGTASIHTALFAAGVRPGDEVITTAFSFGGTFQPILQQHAIPIFVDIDPRTYNIDASQVESKITDKTKVLLPVHMHGLPADMDEILALAKKHNLIVVEDACQAHGATYKGRMAGTIGDIGCFSLNASKNLPGGEGGLSTTQKEEFVQRGKLLRTFGEIVGGEKEKYRPYYCHSIGWNYRCQEMPAALARSQLKRLPHYNATGQRNGQYLTKELSKIKGLIPPYVPTDRTTVYHKYRIRFDTKVLGLGMPAAEFRDKLLDALRAEGMAANLWHYKPLPAYPIFQKLDVGLGDGYPWRSPLYGREISYKPEEYPQATELLHASLVVNDERSPIFAQDMELMEHYVAAFRKVFENLDEVVA
jgi:perosamine synthetase